MDSQKSLKPPEDNQSPDRLDQMIVVTTKKTWIALWTLAAILFLFLLWSFFGNIPQIVDGKGLVLSSAGLFTIESRADGTLKRFFISPGQAVQKGTLIAEIDDPQLDLKLQNANELVKTLETNLAILREQVDKENLAFQAALQIELSSKEFSLKNMQKELEHYKEEYARRKELYKQGLIAFSQILDQEHSINQSEINVATAKADIEDIKARLKKGYRQEELVTKQEELNKAKGEAKLLAIEASFTKVYADENGVVLGLLVNQGDQVKRGEPLVWAEVTLAKDSQQSYTMYAFVSVGDAKSVAVGNYVQIDLSHISKQKFGSLVGKVTNVSQFAVSAELLTRRINNSSLIKYLMGDNVAVALVTIDFVPDPTTPTGYEWTSGRGPSEKITTGSVGKVQIISGSLRPIYYALPIYYLKYIKTRFGSVPYLLYEQTTIPAEG